MLIYQRVYILQHPSFPWNPRKFHPDSLSTAIAATGYPGAKHPYSWWRSQPRWMLHVFTVPWRAVNRILALSMAFSTRKMGGSHWEILTFGVLKWFGSPSHWSILSHGHPWRLDDLGIPPWLGKPLGNGGNLDDWYLDLQFVDDCWLIRPMGNPLRLGHRLMASLSFFLVFLKQIQVGETYLSVSGENWGNKLQASLAKAFDAKQLLSFFLNNQTHFLVGMGCTVATDVILEDYDRLWDFGAPYFQANLHGDGSKPVFFSWGGLDTHDFASILFIFGMWTA